MSQVFYRKWRPQTLADVVGQEQVTRTLLNALGSGNVSHAYLFCGPRGTGKTSTGRILAKAVNCLQSGKGEPCNSCSMCQDIAEGRALDVIEIDAASNRGIDEIRGLREKVGYAPNQARFKVYIIDEVHMLTKEASNALLKTLEEPPPHVKFVLATTEAHKVLPTILSRCQRFDFRRVSQDDVIIKLTGISKAEGISVAPEGLRLLARATTGSLRDAENLLQQLATYYGSDVKLEQVQALLGLTGDWRAREMVKHIVNSDIPAGIATINSANNDGLDLRHFTREVVQYLRALLLFKTGSQEAVDVTAEDRKELESLSVKASLAHVLRAVKLFGQLDLGLDNYSTLPLELAFVDCVLPAAKAENMPAAPAAKITRTVTPAQPQPVAPKAAKPEAVALPKPEVSVPVAAEVESAAPAPLAEPLVKEPKSEAPSISPPKPVESPLENLSEIEKLKKHWRQYINEVPKDPSCSAAVALLRSARPRTIQDDMVTISFRYTYHKEKMDTAENVKAAEKIVSGFLGRSCRVTCIFEPEADHLVKAAIKAGAEIISSEEK